MERSQVPSAPLSPPPQGKGMVGGGMTTPTAVGAAGVGYNGSSSPPPLASSFVPAPEQQMNSPPPSGNGDVYPGSSVEGGAGGDRVSLEEGSDKAHSHEPERIIEWGGPSNRYGKVCTSVLITEIVDTNFVLLT